MSYTSAPLARATRGSAAFPPNCRVALPFVLSANWELTRTRMSGSPTYGSLFDEFTRAPTRRSFR
jgi:hypothetical protein